MAWRKKKIATKSRKGSRNELREMREDLKKELNARGLPEMKTMEMGYAVLNAFRDSDMQNDEVAIKAVNAIKDMHDTGAAKSELMALSHRSQDDADKFERFADEF